MIILIEIILLAMTAILMIHARTQYSISFMKIFWISGFFMGLLRELAMVWMGGLYTYGNFHISLFGLPLVYGVLFSNFSYIAWQWSNNILGREYLRSEASDQNLPLVFLTMVLIAVFFETLLSQYDLIHWQVGSAKNLWGKTPMLAPFTYGFTAVLFLMSIKLISKYPAVNWKLATAKVIGLQPVVIVALMGLLLVSNLLIIFVFS